MRWPLASKVPVSTASFAATCSRVMPMMVITEPVTTGGKNRRILPKTGR